jgi:hypothetical protein
MDLSAFHDFSTKLALFAGTPRVDIAVCRQYEEMVASCGDGYNLFCVMRLCTEIPYGCWKELVFQSAGEAKRAFVGLNK